MKLRSFMFAGVAVLGASPALAGNGVHIYYSSPVPHPVYLTPVSYYPPVQPIYYAPAKPPCHQHHQNEWKHPHQARSYGYSRNYAWNDGWHH